MTVKKTLMQSVVALGVGAGLGLAHHAVNRALVYRAYFARRESTLPQPIVACHIHPGCGLLLWDNGDLQCYYCGKEKYGNTDVKMKRDKVRDLVDHFGIHLDHYHNPASLVKGMLVT